MTALAVKLDGISFDPPAGLSSPVEGGLQECRAGTADLNTAVGVVLLFVVLERSDDDAVNR